MPGEDDIARFDSWRYKVQGSAGQGGRDQAGDLHELPTDQVFHGAAREDPAGESQHLPEQEGDCPGEAEAITGADNPYSLLQVFGRGHVIINSGALAYVQEVPVFNIIISSQ